MELNNIGTYGINNYITQYLMSKANGSETEGGDKSSYIQGLGLLNSSGSENMGDIEKTMLLAMVSSAFGGGNSDGENSSQAFSVMMSSLLRALNEKDQQTQMAIDKNANFDGLHINDINLRPDIAIQTPVNNNKSDGARIEEAIKISSKKHGIDEGLIRAIIKVESDFNPKVVSSAGAMGLMQLMPENVRHYGVSDPFNIEENIDAGTRHIKDYLEMFDNDLEMALVAYNFGPGNMRKRSITGSDDFYKLPTETKNYLVKIGKYYG